jgi:hypothetical protein
VELPVFLNVHSTVNRSRDEYVVLLPGACETNSHPDPTLEACLVGTGVLVAVGNMKTIVAVDVSVSVGVELGGAVGVKVLVGDGTTSAV